MKGWKQRMSDQQQQQATATPKDLAYRDFLGHYRQLAAQLGDVQYRIACMQGDAHNLTTQMQALSQEWSKKMQEFDAPKEEAPKEEPTAPAPEAPAEAPSMPVVEEPAKEEGVAAHG